MYKPEVIACITVEGRTCLAPPTWARPPVIVGHESSGTTAILQVDATS